jgi:hypothetical protein
VDGLRKNGQGAPEIAVRSPEISARQTNRRLCSHIAESFRRRMPWAIIGRIDLQAFLSASRVFYDPNAVAISAFHPSGTAFVIPRSGHSQ